MTLFVLLTACVGGEPASVAAEPTAAQTTWKHFGAPFTVPAAVPAAQVFADPSAQVGKTVRFTGELTQVCQAAGCWAVVRDDAGHSLRVTMKGHAFGIDKDTAGRSCDVEGVVLEKAVDPKTVAHYVSEGGANPPEAGKTRTYEISATSVAVR